MKRRKLYSFMGKWLAVGLAVLLACANLVPVPAQAAETWTAYGKLGPVPSADLGKFNYPMGLEVDTDGNLYVADSSNSRVQKLNATDGTWSVIGNGSGYSTGQMNGPADVALDSAGNIYVAEITNHRVQKWDKASGTWTAWGGTASGSIEGRFNQPKGVAVDGNGNVYVADSANNRIQKLASGASTWTVLSGLTMNSPSDVAVDGSGNIYVLDIGYNRLLKLNSAGVLQNTWGKSNNASGTALGEFSSPTKVSVDSAGNVYVSDTGNGRVQKLSGSTWSALGKNGPISGTGLNEFSSPSGVAADGNGNVYVVELNNHIVLKLTGAAPVVLGGAQGPATGNGLGEFNTPNGVAVDIGGNLYVADGNNNRVQKLSATGPSAGTWTSLGTGIRGTGDGQFKFAAAVAVDKNGNLYVADMSNHRIQKLSPTGAYLSEWGNGVAVGTGLGQFNNPNGVAVDKDLNLYVADTDNNRIQKMSSGGTWTSYGKSGNAAGSALGEFNKPKGVAVDGDGNLYVADTENNRIQKRTVSGEWSEWKKTGSGPGGFLSPNGVAVDGDGNIYVADLAYNRIQKLTLATNTWKVWGGSTQGGTELGAFFNPSGIAVDSNGAIYVADKNNKRIQKLVITAAAPNAPTAVTAVPGTGHATVSFTPPADNGGSDITGYTVTSNPGGITATGASSPITVTGLTNMTAYTFTVVATNEKGDSPPSAPSASVTPALVPFAPTGASATAGNGQATVSFTPPLSDGGSAITSYTVTSSPGGRTGTGAASPITVTGLTNGTAYTFTVVAKNAIGSSASSLATEIVTPIGPPSAPTSVDGAAQNGAVLVSFTLPANDGGSSITGYTVTSIPEGKTGSGSASPILVSGLTNGTAYMFTVVATNANGDSLPSMPSTSVTPALPPGAPTGVTAASTASGQATVSFTPPADNGGSAITGYTVTASPGGRTGTGFAGPITVTGLTNGTAYTFTVVATNGAGDSQPSAPSESVTPVGVPDAPTGAAAAPGNGQAVISFTPPAGNGGSAITGYTVTSNPGGFTGTGTAGPITVSGLTNGTSYTFTVVATNAIGNSAPSAPTASVTPAVQPTDAPVLQSAAGGDGQATLVWGAVAGATGYKIFQSVTAGTLGAEVATVGAAVYSYTATGLTNGETYYYAVKSTNEGGDSAASNQLGVTPQVPSPGAPVLQSAVAGSGQVTLVWGPVTGSTGYKVFQSETAGTYGNEIATVGGAVYGYQATGLTNGVTYYFAVKATNPGGDSAASNSISAMPVGVPGAPVNVAATAGDGEAYVTFTAPGNNGGSPITGYEVTASPGGIGVIGTASPIRVQGLSNGTSYTFTVKAINSIGDSEPSAASNAVVPVEPEPEPVPNNPPAGPSAPTTPTASQTPGTGVDVLINGKAESAGTATTATENDRTVMTVAIDPQKLEEKLAAEKQGAVVTIPVMTKADAVIGELNGQMVRNMEQKQATVEIATEKAAYTLPAQLINIQSISEQLGQTVALQDIKVRIEIAATQQDMVKVVESSAANGEFAIVAPPINFTVKAVYGDKTIEVSQFDAYVERRIALPSGIDPAKITTAVVVEPDGTVRHVPTKVVVIDGSYYAVVNSLTNSTYSLVWHPQQFKDVAGHWANEAVNDMGSRMIVSGVGSGLFHPDQDMTRAEFAAIMVNGLGLRLEKQTSTFADVKAPDWYADVIQTAYSANLINGFEDGTFRPMDKITREQAMTIIANAMKLTGLQAKLPSGGITLSSFTDGDRVAEWAMRGVGECLQAGLVSGRDNAQLEPKAYVTRAEVAVMLQKLLQKSDLI